MAGPYDWGSLAGQRLDVRRLGSDDWSYYQAAVPGYGMLDVTPWYNNVTNELQGYYASVQRPDGTWDKVQLGADGTLGLPDTWRPSDNGLIGGILQVAQAAATVAAAYVIAATGAAAYGAAAGSGAGAAVTAADIAGTVGVPELGLVATPATAAAATSAGLPAAALTSSATWSAFTAPTAAELVQAVGVPELGLVADPTTAAIAEAQGVPASVWSGAPVVDAGIGSTLSAPSTAAVQGATAGAGASAPAAATGTVGSALSNAAGSALSSVGNALAPIAAGAVVDAVTGGGNNPAPRPAVVTAGPGPTVPPLLIIGAVAALLWLGNGR